MRANIGSSAADTEGFLDAVADLTASLGWQARSFSRDEELVVLAPLDHDRSFEQFLWVYDTTRSFARCLLVGRGTVPPERESAIIELCARINDGLVFGCAEFSFRDRTLVFRDSTQLGDGEMRDLVRGVSARLLDLGARYAPAVRATLAGEPPAEAMKHTPG